MTPQRLLQPVLLTAALALTTGAMAQDISKPEARNMRLVGYSDLQARTAYHPVIQHQGNRWIAYIGHHGDYKLNPLNGRMEHNGTSIVEEAEVPDPHSR